MQKFIFYFKTSKLNTLYLSIIIALFIFYILIFTNLMKNEELNLSMLINDKYILHVILFSLWQAFLSTILSIILGIINAWALFYVKLFGKKYLIKIFSMIFVLPSLLVIFAILSIYGNAGFIQKVLLFFNINIDFNIYGLSGILIAHVFLNMPFATRIFLQSLNSIPNHQYKLSSMLNLSFWNHFRIVEFKSLKSQIIPIATVIFMLCFSSFAIILTLGGGPKYTNLTVSIYQAILYEFDLGKATILSLIQIIICFIIFIISNYFHKENKHEIQSKKIIDTQTNLFVKLIQYLIVFINIIFLLSPLISIIYSGLVSNELLNIFNNEELIKALLFSLSISICSAILSLLMAINIILFIRRMSFYKYNFIVNTISNFSNLILVIPSLIIALGFFALLRNINLQTPHLFLIVTFCNALLALPIIMKILYQPLLDNMRYYEKSCANLNIVSWNRFFLIEKNNLKRPISYSLAMAMAISLGDFSSIALFGNQDFTSLTRLLYEQLASYHFNSAAITSLVLMLLFLILFLIIDRNYDKNYDKY